MAARTVEVVFLGSTAQLEAALTRAGLVAKESGSNIGDAFDKGSAKAGNALERLGKTGASFGIPFSNSLANIGQRFEEADTKGKKFSTTMSALGGATLLGAGAAMAGVSVEAVKLADSFDKSVARIAGASGIPVEQAKRIGMAFLDTAGKSVYSGNEMAAAFAPVSGQLKTLNGSALTAGQSLTFMSAAGNLAEGSQSSLDSSTAALASVMQSYHLNVSQAAGASDVLFNVSNALNVPIGTVAAAVDKLHARLGIMAPTMADVSALMLSLGEHGLTGSKGIQGATASLSTLVGGSKATTTVLGDLGLKTSDLYGPHGFIGMAAAIDLLRPKLTQLTGESQKSALIALFGKSAWQYMGRIIADGVPGYDKATAAVTKLGTAHRAAELQSHTLGGEIKTLEATLSDLGTKLGLVLVPIIQQFGQSLANTITWMEKHKAVAEALAAVISGVLGTAVLVFAEQKAVKFGKSIGSMISDMGKLVSGIETGVTKIIGQFGLQDSAVAGSATKMAASSEAASGSVAAEATAITTSTGEVDTAFAGTATAAEGAAAKVGTAVAGEVTAVSAADGTIEADNVAVGASFTKMLGPIGLVAAAIYGLSQLPWNSINNSIDNALGLGGHVTPVAGESIAQARAQMVKAGYPTSVINRLIAEAKAAGDFKGGKYTGPGASRAAAAMTTGPGAAHSGGAGGAAVQGMTGAFSTGTNAALGTQQGFAASLLASLGAPATAGNIAAITAWSNAEKPWGTGPDTNNPLDITIAPGVSTNSAGVKAIPTAQQGLQATAQFIMQRTPGILAALRAGTSPAALSSAVTASGWGTGPFGGASTLPTGTNTIPSPSAKSPKAPSTSNKFNWQTGQYENMTAAQYKVIQDAWYNQSPRPTVPVPTSAAALHKDITPVGLSPSVASGFTTAGQQVAGIPATMQAKEVAKGQSLLNTMTNATVSTSYRVLVNDTNAIHKKALDTLVQELKATHVAGFVSLAGQLESIFKTEEVAKNNVIEGLQQQLAATLTNKVTADMHNAAANMTQAVKDAMQTATDQFTAAATAISDATQAAADAASGQSTAISDAAQVTVDTLGERGLYGLNLVAQQMTVAGDQQKSVFDSQISAAQQAIDSAQAQGDSSQAVQTAVVDAVTAQQNVLVGKAQANLDTVTAQQNTLVQQAQNAVDQGVAGSQAALKAAQGTASYTEAQAQQQLTAAQDAANAAVAQAQSALANANGQASVVIAQAQQALGQAQDQAQVAEAQSAAAIAIEKAKASTQFAGSGLTISIVGIPTTDAAAIASEVAWVGRSQFSAPIAA